MPQYPKPVPRIRKQKARRRAESTHAVAPPSTVPIHSDSNAVELLPLSSSEKERRRLALREELRANKPETKGSAKKRKRLDKYIEIKLRKEENAGLIRKLAAQQIVDTGLLRSSKKLGRGEETKREFLGRTLKEKRAGIGGEDDEEILMEERRVRDVGDHTTLVPGSAQNSGSAITNLPAPTPQAGVVGLPPTFGSGLKRPLEVDENGRPIIKRRKKLEVVPKSWELPTAEEEVEEEDWVGFSSDTEDGGVELETSLEEQGSEDSEEEEEEEERLDSSTSDTSIDDGDDEYALARKERSNAFKAWATQSRNEALGFSAVNILDSLPAKEASKTPIERETDLEMHRVQREAQAQASSLPKVPELASSANVFHVSVQRAQEIEDARLRLPVVAEEQKIMETIRNNDITVICGATGSGKTTQVPQFLFEAGYGNPAGPTPGMVGVTQPRRVAAVSMAKRVASELGDSHTKVAHQIRFDSTVSSTTAVKFMTDGVLLREVGLDFTLSKYSAIVLDEAHERSVNTDILIGMLSRVVETRAELSKKSTKFTPLKVVIMSATLKTADLLDNGTLFRRGAPPIVEVEGRQYPVTVHFAKRTERDYIGQVFGKVSRGHKKLPPGAMLVFLTGQSEIQQLSLRLRQAFASTDGGGRTHTDVRVSAADASIEDEDFDFGKQEDELDGEDEDSDAEIHGVDNDEDKKFDVGDDPEELLKVHILPLYSQLPTEEQMRVFIPPPDGSRMIVLATNVAETSLTIPGVRYVFDCGRAKEKRYDQKTGVQSFGVSWISKASASQRSGRAGRTGPGHCYRLYSSAVYERDFDEFTTPEILRMPADGVVLQLKSMGIPKVAHFPFPTSPDRASLVKAEKLLQYLGALSNDKVTEVGKQLALYPLSPRLSRMLCQAQELGIIQQAVSLVALMTVGDAFVPEAQLDIQEERPLAEGDEWTELNNREVREREQRRKEYNSFHGSLSRLGRLTDALKLLTTLNDFASPDVDTNTFRHFTRTKALSEALQLRRQLMMTISIHSPTIKLSLTAPLVDPSKAQLRLFPQTIASGYIDQIAQRADLSPTPPFATEGGSNKPKRAIDVPYLTLFPSQDGTSSISSRDDEDGVNSARRKYVYIHPSSVLAHQPTSKMPQYIIYSHLSQGTPSAVNMTRLPKTRLHPLTPISVEQIIEAARGTPLLEDGKPIGRIESLERDVQGRERRAVWTVPYLVPGNGGGGVGWPLPPARKVVQRREGTRGWVDVDVE